MTFVDTSTEAFGVSKHFRELEQKSTDIYYFVDEKASYLELLGFSFTQFAVSTWVLRVSGFLSFCGSGYIIWDVLFGRKKRRRRKQEKCRGTARGKNDGPAVYNELVVGMSLFDLTSSVAWIVSSAAVPQHLEDGSPTGIYGARGNQATCRAQGFFIQFGMVGATFYNACLSFYYLLTIVYNRRDNQFRNWKARTCFHGIPSVFAWGLSLAGIPFYKNLLAFCQIAGPPQEKTWIAPALLSITPVALVLVVAHANMAYIFWSVRRQERAAQKWLFECSRGRVNQDSTTNHAVSSSPKRQKTAGRPAGKMERAVLWQGFFYLVALLLTWLPFLLSFWSALIQTYPMHIISFTLTPLQGFLNMLVYVRPRCKRFRFYCCCRFHRRLLHRSIPRGARSSKNEKQSTNTTSGPDSNSISEKTFTKTDPNLEKSGPQLPYLTCKKGEEETTPPERESWSGTMSEQKKKSKPFTENPKSVFVDSQAHSRKPDFQNMDEMEFIEKV